MSRPEWDFGTRRQASQHCIFDYVFLVCTRECNAVWREIRSEEGEFIYSAWMKTSLMGGSLWSQRTINIRNGDENHHFVEMIAMFNGYRDLFKATLRTSTRQSHRGICPELLNGRKPLSSSVNCIRILNTCWYLVEIVSGGLRDIWEFIYL